MTPLQLSGTIGARMKVYSTPFAAKELRLGLRTLKRYLAQGKLPGPEVVQVGSKPVRMWTKADIEKIRKILPKIANGRKTRYKKKGPSKKK